MAYLQNYSTMVQGGTPTPMAITPAQIMDASSAPLMGVIFDRPAFAHVRVSLQPNQVVVADGGAMIWMDGHVPVKTEMGDCWQACWRAQCAGESLCQNHFTGPGNVSFSFKLPGDMLPFGVTPQAGWITPPGAFICGSSTLQVSARFAGCLACLCGQTRPFLTKINIKEGVTENGVFWAGGYGAITRNEVPDGQELWVSSGLFFAANDKTDIHLALPGGCLGCLYGGEGIVMKFKGPAVIYTQNRNPKIWDRILHPPPKKQKKNTASASVSF